jgi:hypothetical protein
VYNLTGPHTVRLSRLLPPSWREPARELYIFLRFPLVVRGSPGRPTVVLCGIPFGDWNATLSRADLWQGIAGRVLRLPYRIASLARWLLPGAVFIPMKEPHICRARGEVRTLSPGRAALEALGDKSRFAAYVRREGLGDYTPRVYASLAEAEFPCVLKRTDASASYGIRIASSATEAEAMLESPTYRGHDVVLQAAVEGDREYCTYCVCKNGRVLWTRTFVNVLATPLTIRTEDNVLSQSLLPTPARIVDQIEAVLAPLAYSGPCNIDYKLVDDRMRIHEINPRLGGTLFQESFRHELREALACIVENAD